MGEIVRIIQRGRNANDMVGVTINSDYFTQGAAWISFRPVRDLKASDLCDLIDRIAQSKREFTVNDSFIVAVTYVQLPNGRGDPDETLAAVYKKDGILKINNRDNLCLPRALVCGEINSLKNSSNEWKAEWRKIKLDGEQKRRASELLNSCRIVLNDDDGCGIQEIRKFQEFYATKNVCIRVYDSSTIGTGADLIFNGEREMPADYTRFINIMYSVESRHYDLILSFLSIKAKHFFCVSCNVSYRETLRHRCENVCSACNGPRQCVSVNDEKRLCNDCGREFFNENCFRYHKNIISAARDKNSSRCKRSICDKIKICQICHKLFDVTKTRHECGRTYCKVCRSMHSNNELCHMQPVPKTSEISRTNGHPKCCFIFYDLETTQDTIISESMSLHKPNLCVAQVCCEFCAENNNLNDFCNYCGVREFVFKGDDCLKKFLEFAVRTEKKYFSSFICIAHNAKAFDAQFVLKYIVDNFKNIKPHIILNGLNILKLKVGKTTFIDSLSYFNMKLSSLPATFGLGGNIQKGYFPHLFNTNDNQGYEGPYPDARYYDPDCMSESERGRFYTWYREMQVSSCTFDLQRELEKYCKQDVTILRRACVIFRKIFLEIGSVDPFSESATIASACMLLFKKNYLNENEIGLLPTTGYRRSGNFSEKCIRWLLWEEARIGREIVHAGRSREYNLIEGWRVDGFLHQPVGKGTVYQFHGCYYHGCPRCFLAERKEKLFGKPSLNDKFENTVEASKKIKAYGYELIEMWECDFDRELGCRQDFKNFIAAHPLSNRITLNPREAFFGGRTGNIVTCYNVSGREQIRYLDVCSLYPYICKTGKYPIGHPKIYTAEECLALTGDSHEYFEQNVEGLVKCEILPPRMLFHPVLPVKMHDRLLFPLCRTCCESMSQTACTHENENERVLTGTWVSAEICEALRTGYRLKKVHVIWQYRVTQYDRASGEGGLFVQYINTFLKLKQEASGWPSHVSTEQEKQSYIREYKLQEGIDLEFEKIEFNPGLRSVAKLALNSFWGKFGQRDNLSQTTVVRSHTELCKLLIDPSIQVGQLIQAGDDVMYVHWKYIEEAVSSSSSANVVIAAYTTAQARLKLLVELQRLGDRVLYYDTDSVIYVNKNNDTPEYEPEIGPFLGQMTDELSTYGAGSYVETFVSGGPKFYAYRVRAPDGERHDICKIKGFRLNYKNSQKLNFNSISNLIASRANDRNNILIKNKSIKRTALHEVVTVDDQKTCSVVLKKRRFLNDRLSYPYGYKET